MDIFDSSIHYRYLLGKKDFDVYPYRHNDRFFPFVSLTHVIEGEFLCECDGKIYSAKKNETMYVPECVLHNVYTKSLAKANWAHLAATSYKYDLMKNTRCPVVIKGESSIIISDYLARLASIKYDSLSALYERDNCISGIFYELFKYTEYSATEEIPAWCINLQSYISEHIKEKFNLDELAKMMFVSKSTLCHNFKSVKGITLITYIQKEKIKSSFYMLADGMNNRQIAEKLNLSDEYYFSKLFKKTVGISPKEYKNTYITKQHIL